MRPPRTLIPLLWAFTALIAPALPAQDELRHICQAHVEDGYLRPLAGVPVHVDVWSIEPPGWPDSSFTPDYTTMGTTDSSGSVEVPVDWSTAKIWWRCRVRAQDLPRRGVGLVTQGETREEANHGFRLQLDVTVAPPPDGTLTTSGLNPDGLGTGSLYMGSDGVYDKVLVIPQGMDFGEQDAELRTDRDRFWFTFRSMLQPLHFLGYDVWMFRPYKTGQNIHEQAAELAQAIQRAANWGGGAYGGKVGVLGVSLGGVTARLATARWEADADWRQALGLGEELPIHLLAFGDSPLRGANASVEMQQFLWEKGKEELFNLNSCAAQQLLISSCDGAGCRQNNYYSFYLNGAAAHFFAQNGVCDHLVGLLCTCDAGPPVWGINGDGFAHSVPTVGVSFGDWQPPHNQCYGGERDYNASYEDLCPRDPGHGGPFVPQPGNVFADFRTDCGFEHTAFHATGHDLDPGSRFPASFDSLTKPLESDDFASLPWIKRKLGELLCNYWYVDQNWAFTFIPVWSALAADDPAHVPFDDWRTAGYMAAHNRPPESLIAWMIGKFEEVYGAPPGGGEPGLPPAPPSDLKAIPKEWQETLVDLSWRDRSYNEDGFAIYRLGGGVDHWVHLDDVGPGVTSYRDQVPTLPGPGGGVAYYFYKVRAFNDYGTSPDSNRAEARMFSEPPSRPDTLRPRGCIDTLRPTLHWRGGGDATQFYVRLLNAATGEPVMDDPIVDTNSFSEVPLLARNTPYMLRVWGMNNIGRGSGSAAEYFVPFCEELTAPVLEVPDPGCLASVPAAIDWTPVAGALWYHLRINRVGGGDPEIASAGIEAPATTWPVPAGLLVPGQEYRVKVKASNGVDGPYSQLRYFVPQCTAATLGTAAAVAPVGSVDSAFPTYSWEPAAGAASYALKVITATGAAVGAVSFPDPTAVCDAHLCSARPTSLPLADDTYRFWVEASRPGAGPTVGPYAQFTVAQAPLALSVLDTSLAEGTGASVVAHFRVRLNEPPANPVTFTYSTADDTAVAPDDYIATTGSASLGIGETEVVVEVPVVADALFEADESFFLRLVAANGASIADGQGVAVLGNDDPRPRDAVFVAESLPASLVAGQTYTLDLTVHNTGSLPWSPLGPQCNAFRLGVAPPLTGTTWGIDRVELPAPVPAGGEITLHPTVTAPAVTGTYALAWQMVQECVEWFGSPSTGGLVTVTPPPPPVIAVSPAEVTELDKAAATVAAVFTVSLDHAASEPVTVSYATADCTADAGSDYQAAAGSLTFSPGGPLAQTVTVNVYGDVLPEGDETFLLELTNPVGGSLGEALGNGVIRDNDRTAALTPRADWNGDGKSDLLWLDTASGDHLAGLLDGLVRLGTSAFTPAQPASGNWQVVAAGDFTGDGKADLVWQNLDSGNLSLWAFDGTLRTSGTAFAGPGADWRVAASGDFDADGRRDLLFRNQATGELRVWSMDGATKLGEATIANPPDLGWRLAAAGDLDSDGKPDLLWHHGTSGALVVWWLDGTTAVGVAALSPASLDPVWQVAGTWDVDLDGSNDIVFQHSLSHRQVVWFMHGGAQAGSKICGTYLAPAAPPTATLVAIGPR